MVSGLEPSSSDSKISATLILGYIKLGKDPFADSEIIHHRPAMWIQTQIPGLFETIIESNRNHCDSCKKIEGLNKEILLKTERGFLRLIYLLG